MDNLQKYLQQHKQSMDLDDPSGNVWDGIDSAINTNGQYKLRKIMYRVAAAAAILSAIIVAGVKLSDDKPGKQGTVKVDVPVHSPVRKLADSAQPARQEIALAVNKKEMPKSQKKNPGIKSKPVDERYAMMQSFKENYGQLVNYQRNSIRSTAVYAENPAYFDDFKIRLQQMDKDEVAIRRTIRQKGMSNNLLEQLINVYQQKLDVLKSLQGEINKMNERVKQQPDSLNKYYLNI